MKTTTKTILAIALAALSMSAAQATELVKATLLPDDGFGSEANGFMDYTDDACMIVGQKTNLLGRSVPMAWDLDNDGQVVAATALPMPPGFQGGCCNVAELADGQAIVAGNLIGTDGRIHAVIWRKPVMGEWTSPQMLAPNANQSSVSDTAAERSPDFGLAALSVQIGGVWRPAVAEISSFLVNIEALPVMGGGDAMALGLDRDESGFVVVCGFVTLESGMRKPAQWDINNDGTYDLSLVPVPPNVGGASNTVGIIGGEWLQAGAVTVNGRTRGRAWDGDYGFDALNPLSGYADSTATNLGDTGTHEVGHWVFGRSSNPNGNGEATGWVNGRAVPVQQLLKDPSSVESIVAYEWDTDGDSVVCSAVGQVVPAPGFPAQAAFFGVTDNNVPAKLDTELGITFDDGTGPWKLWHNDGNELRTRTQRTGGARMAVLNLVFTPLNRSIVKYEWDFDYNAVVRCDGNGPGASGTLEISAFCHTHGEQEQLGSATVGSTNSSFSFGVNQGLHHYRDAAGAIHTKLRFTQNGNQPTVLVTDEFGLSLTPP